MYQGGRNGRRSEGCRLVTIDIWSREGIGQLEGLFLRCTPHFQWGFLLDLTFGFEDLLGGFLDRFVGRKRDFADVGPLGFDETGCLTVENR